MNGIITDTRFKTVVNVPVSLPETDLRHGDSLIVSTIKLELGQTLTIGWLSLQLLKINLSTTIPTRLNSSLGFVYLGIFAGGFEPLREPSGLPISFISLSGPNVKVMNPYTNRVFSGPDVIEIIVVNNTIEADVELMVTGSLKLYTRG